MHRRGARQCVERDLMDTSRRGGAATRGGMVGEGVLINACVYSEIPFP
jgi:hypothetical protein